MSKHKKQKNQKRPFSLPQDFKLHPSIDIRYIEKHFICNCLFFAPTTTGNLLSCQFIALDTSQVVFSTGFHVFANPEPTFQENFLEVTRIANGAVALNNIPFRIIVIMNEATQDEDDSAFALVPQSFQPHPQDLVTAFEQHIRAIQNEEADNANPNP